MKICKKCHKEYKDDYIYCPKCGKPYDDNMEIVKTPSTPTRNNMGFFQKCWNVFLYIFGTIFSLGCITIIKDASTQAIVGFFLGLSLFPFFYNFIEDKFLIDKKYLIISRIVIPIVLLITIGIVAPTNVQNNPNSSNTSNITNSETYNTFNENTNNNIFVDP